MIQNERTCAARHRQELSERDKWEGGKITLVVSGAEESVAIRERHFEGSVAGPVARSGKIMSLQITLPKGSEGTSGVADERWVQWVSAARPAEGVRHIDGARLQGWCCAEAQAEDTGRSW